MHFEYTKLERSTEIQSDNDLRMINDPYNIIFNYKRSRQL